MSSEGEAPKPKKEEATGPLRDPLQQLALDIYVGLCQRIYSASGQGKPDPKAVAQLAFKLAENFEKCNLVFNPVARAAFEAKNKASVNVSNVEIDFASIGAAAKATAEAAAPPAEKAAEKK